MDKQQFKIRSIFLITISLILVPGFNAFCNSTKDTLLFENFEESSSYTNWTVIDSLNDDKTWFVYAAGASNLDGTDYAMVNSDNAGTVDINEYLLSPYFNGSGNYDTIWLEFDHYFRYYLYGGEEVGDVDVWNGNNWINVYRRTTTVGAWNNPNHQKIDITHYANDNLRVRFHYYNANYDWWWAVDNVIVTGVDLGCPTIGFNDITASAPYICGDTVLLKAYDSIQAGGFITPGFRVVITTDMNSDTESSITFFEDETVFYEIPLNSVPENTLWTLWSEFMSPSKNYSFQWCDTAATGSFPYKIYDNISGELIAQDTIVHTGNTSCYTINIGYLDGFSSFSGTAIIDNDSSGTAKFIASTAGGGSYDIIMCFEDGEICSACDSQTVAVDFVIADAGNDTTICDGSRILLGGSPSGSGGKSPLLYQWSPSEGLSSTTSSNPVSIINTNITYTLIVTDSGLCSDTSEIVISTYSNDTIFSPSSNQTYYTSGGKYYDSGGAGSNYSNNEDYVVTFYPCDANRKLHFDFTSFSLQSNGTCSKDYLKVYDGTSISSTLLGKYCGTGSFGVTSTNASGALTFQFHSNNSTVASGWLADITSLCISSPVADAGTDISYCQNDTGELGGSPTASGGNGSTYSYLWSPSTALSSNTIANPTTNAETTIQYTVMVTDSLFCTDVDTVIVSVSGDSSEYRMNSNNTYYVTGGKFYDSGGAYGDYSYNEDYVVTFYPCDEFHFVKLDFTDFDVEYQATCSYDWLKIYNGPSTSSPLVTGYCGTGIFNVTSTDPSGALTFQFHSDYIITGNGWEADISIDCQKPGVDAGFDIGASGGTVVQIGGNPTASGGTGEYTYHWTPAENLNDNTVANPTVITNDTTTYFLVVTDSSGCVSESDSITLFEIPDTATLTPSSSVHYIVKQGTFHDSGGASGDYEYNQNYTVVLKPIDQFSKLSLDFTYFDLEAHASCAWDWMKIYVGTDDEPQLVGSYCGTNSPGKIISPMKGGKITIEFFSDGSITGGGWAATIMEEMDSMKAAFRITKECYSSEGILALEVDNGAPPFSYLWSTSDTTASINYYAAGEYSVTITDAWDSVMVDTIILDTLTRSTVDWTDFESIELGGDTIRKPALRKRQKWDNGVASINELMPHIDGFVEYSESPGSFAFNRNMNRVLGLSNSNVAADYKSIDYSFYFGKDTLRICENGIFKGNPGFYDANDRFRIERIGDTIRYIVNEQILDTTIVTNLSDSSLIVDVAILQVFAYFTGIRTSFCESCFTAIIDSVGDGCSSSNPTFSLLEDPSENIQWQRSYDNLTFFDIEGATTNPYTDTTYTTSYYRAQVVYASGDTCYSTVISYSTGNNYYVNDNSSQGDEFCTNIGDALNNGLSPATPQISLEQIFTLYDLHSCDTVFVDNGLFEEDSVLIDSTDFGTENFPVVIYGVTDTSLSSNVTLSSQLNGVFLKNTSGIKFERIDFESDGCTVQHLIDGSEHITYVSCSFIHQETAGQIFEIMSTTGDSVKAISVINSVLNSNDKGFIFSIPVEYGEIRDIKVSYNEIYTVNQTFQYTYSEGLLSDVTIDNNQINSDNSLINFYLLFGQLSRVNIHQNNFEGGGSIEFKRFPGGSQMDIDLSFHNNKMNIDSNYALRLFRVKDVSIYNNYFKSQNEIDASVFLENVTNVDMTFNTICSGKLPVKVAIDSVDILKIVNNIFKGSGPSEIPRHNSAIYFKANSSSPSYYSNISLDNNMYAGYSYIGGYSTTFLSNLADWQTFWDQAGSEYGDDNSIVDNPQFLDYQNGNLDLSLTSPGFGLAVYDSLIQGDIYDQQRPDPPAMGAFDYPLIYTAHIINAKCDKNQTGSIVLDLGGVAVVDSIVWSNNDTLEDQYNLEPGYYSNTIYTNYGEVNHQHYVGFDIDYWYFDLANSIQGPGHDSIEIFRLKNNVLPGEPSWIAISGKGIELINDMDIGYADESEDTTEIEFGVSIRSYDSIYYLYDGLDTLIPNMELAVDDWLTIEFTGSDKFIVYVNQGSSFYLSNRNPNKVYGIYGEIALKDTTLLMDSTFQIVTDFCPNCPDEEPKNSDTLVKCIYDMTDYEVTGLDSVQWYPSIGVDCDTCSNVIIIAVQDTNYVIVGKDYTGSTCYMMLTVLINDSCSSYTTPALEWTMNACSGDTAFETYNDQHGEILGEGLFGDGHVGQSLNINAEAWVEIDDDPILNFTDNITVICWINETYLDTNSVIIAKYGQDQMEWALRKDSVANEIRLDLGALEGSFSGYVRTIDTVLVDSLEWHQIAFSFNSGTVVLYVDGQPSSHQEIGVIPTELFNGTAPLIIGNWALPDTGLFAFYGIVDEIRIYDQVLTSLEIENVYLSQVYAPSYCCEVEVSKDESICQGDSIMVAVEAECDILWTPTSGINDSISFLPYFSPDVTTIYTITATNHECVDYDSITITVLSNPDVSVSGDRIVCMDDTVHLVASGGTEYAWLPVAGLDNALVASPVCNTTVSTNYIVTVTGSNGCIDTAAVFINILPHMEIFVEDTFAICRGDTALFNAFGLFGAGHQITSYGAINSLNEAIFLPSSIEFDGSDYLEIPNQADWNLFDNDFTIDFWVNFANFSNDDPYILSISEASDFHLAVQYKNTDNPTNWNIIINNTSYAFDTTVTSSEWAHIAIVRRNGMLSLFKNGVKNSTQHNVTAESISGTANLYISSDHNQSNKFSGYLDEIRLSKNIARWTTNFAVADTSYLSVAGQNDIHTFLLIQSSCNDPELIEDKSLYNLTVANNNVIHSETDPIFQNSSLRFNGSSAYLEIDDDNLEDFNTKEFDIDFRVKFDDVNNSQYLIGLGDTTASGTGWYFKLENQKLKFRFYNFEGDYVEIGDSSNLSSETWYHVAAVRAMDTIYLYLDGKYEGSPAVVDTMQEITSSLKIGMLANTEYFKGYMDEIRISKGFPVWPLEFTPPQQSYSDFVSSLNIYTKLLITSDYEDISDLFADSSYSGNSNCNYLWSPALGLSDTTITGPLAYPTVSTNYNVEITNVNTCTENINVYLEVYDLPIATAELNTSVVAGDSIQLVAGGGSSYAWFPQSGLDKPFSATPMASPGVTTEYGVVVTNSTGCKDTAYIVVNVTGANAGNDTSFCFNTNLQLNASDGVSWAWSPSNGLSAVNIQNPIANPALSTVYSVSVTDSYGLVYTDEILVSVDVNCLCDSNNFSGNTFFWMGDASTNWTDANNWSPNGVPGTDANDNVVFDSTSYGWTNSPVLDGDRFINNICVLSGTVDLSEYTLEAVGNGTFTGGQVRSAGVDIDTVAMMGILYLNNEVSSQGKAYFMGTEFSSPVLVQSCEWLYLNGSVFNKPCSFGKSGDETVECMGGNTYNKSVEFINTGEGVWKLAGAVGSPSDKYNGNVTFDNQEVLGSIYPSSWARDSYKKDISILSSSVTFGKYGGTVTLDGSIAQRIKGNVPEMPPVFRKLKIDQTVNSLVTGIHLDIDVVAGEQAGDSLIFAHGNIYSSDSNLLIVSKGEVVYGASDSSFVSGPVKKISNEDFRFPVGKNGRFLPVSISDVSSVNDSVEYIAEFMNAGHASSAFIAPIAYVSTCNHWRLESTDTAKVNVTLTWDELSCGITMDLTKMRLVGWSPSALIWQNLGFGEYTGSMLSGGTLKNTDTIPEYTLFTIGSVIVPGYGPLAGFTFSNYGDNVDIEDGGYLNVHGNVLVARAYPSLVKGTFTNRGEIRLNNDWSNYSMGDVFDEHTGIIRTFGNYQRIMGLKEYPTYFNNLYLEGYGKKVLLVSSLVYNLLDLSHNRLETKENTLFVTNPDTASIIRTSGYVSSQEGVGYLARTIQQNKGYLFPVGSSDYYRPVLITNNHGIDSTFFAVNMTNENPDNYSFNREYRAATVEAIHDKFFHRIKSGSQSDTVRVEIFFDPSIDGPYQSLGYCDNDSLPAPLHPPVQTNPVRLWKSMPDLINISSNPAVLSSVGLDSWSDFKYGIFSLIRAGIVINTDNFGNPDSSGNGVTFTMGGDGFPDGSGTYQTGTGNTSDGQNVSPDSLQGEYSMIIAEEANTLGGQIMFIVDNFGIITGVYFVDTLGVPHPLSEDLYTIIEGSYIYFNSSPTVDSLTCNKNIYVTLSDDDPLVMYPDAGDEFTVHGVSDNVVSLTIKDYAGNEVNTSAGFTWNGLISGEVVPGVYIWELVVTSGAEQRLLMGQFIVK